MNGDGHKTSEELLKKKTKETSRGVTTFPPVGLLRRIMGFLEEVEPKHD